MVQVTGESETSPEAKAPQLESASRIVWALAWPAVALNSLQVVNNLLDRVFLGKLEDSALTAHGASINVLFLVFSLAVSLGTGATAIVARAFGAGRRRECRVATREAFRLTVILGLLLAIATWFFAPAVSTWILPADDHRAIELMTQFVRQFSFGLPAIFIIQSLAGCLRGVGDTKSPMVISGIQILTHICLNFLFIFPSHRIGSIEIPGAGMGLPGAGRAMALSAWLSALVYMPYLSRTKLGPVMQFKLPKIQWSERILKIAVPAAVMSTLRVLSLTVFTVALAKADHGSAAIAAMSIGFAIESIMFMPAFGLSVAAGALVGQSLGAQDKPRAERLGWSAANWAALVTLCLAVPIFAGADVIAGALVPNKPMIERSAAELLRYLCLTEILFAYAMVLFGAMQGAGDTKAPLWISLLALWGLRVPLGWILTLRTGQPLFGSVVMPWGANMGAQGAWIAMSSTQAVQGVLAILAFRAGAWKNKKV